MTVRVVGMTNGSDTAESVRLALSLFMGLGEGGVLGRRGGLVPYPGSGNLTGPSPMVGRVSSLIAWVDGTSSANQGGYPIIVDANVDVTFDPGEAGVARVDRVVLQVRDHPYDASGNQDARVVIVKGQVSGAANAVPASSELLWEVTVPAGASSGGGGFVMADQRVDKRRWTTGHGGMLQVHNEAELFALAPYEGMQAYRLDQSEAMLYRAGEWAWNSPPRVALKTVTEAYKFEELQDDNELFLLGLPAGAYYDVDLIFVYSAHSATNIKTAWSSPSGGDLEYQIINKYGPDQGSGGDGTPVFGQLNSADVPVSGGYSFDNNTSKMTMIIHGTLWTGTGGNLKLQWGVDDEGGGVDAFVYWPSRLTLTRVR